MRVLGACFGIISLWISFFDTVGAAQTLPLKTGAAPPPPLGVSLKPGESPIDLATALHLAGAHNPELLLARERVTEAMAIKQLAAAQALPNINAGLNFNLHRGNLQQANGNILKVDRDAMYVGLGANAVGAGTVGVPGINYNLNVGTAWFLHLQAKQLVAVASAESRTAQNEILLRVCLAYTDLLRSSARLAVFSQNRTEAEELVKLTEAYAKAGQGRKADADRAAVELRKREAEITQAEADYASASARLARLLNLDPVVRLVPVEGAALPAPIVPDPVSVTELVAMSLLQRPELEARRAEVQAALYALSSAKLLPFSPNVILGFSTGAFGGGGNLTPAEPRFGNFDNRNDFDAAVYFTLQNLGVGNVAIAKAAGSRARQADLRQQETFNRVRADVVDADARARAKLKQIDTTFRAVETSKEAFTQDMLRIKGREGLPIEVIDSLRLLARSRVEYLDAIIDYNRSQFQLYVALGQPPAGALARPVTPALPNVVLPTPSNPEKK